MPRLSDELDDIADQYKQLEKTPWAQAYEQGFKAALNNHQAKVVGQNFEAFKTSAEG